MDYRSTEEQNSNEAGRCCRCGKMQQVLLTVMILCVLHPASSDNLSTHFAPQDLIVEKDATILKILPGYYEFTSQEELPKTLCTVEGSYDSSIVPRILLTAPFVFTCPKVIFYGFLKIEASPILTPVPVKPITPVPVKPIPRVQLTGSVRRKQQQHSREMVTAKLSWHRRRRSPGPQFVTNSTCVNGLFVSIAENANITFSNCHSFKFTQNFGGALYATSLDVAGNITFNDCSADTGGAVFVQGDMNILTSAVATFNDCSAASGGGLYTGGVLSISGSAAFKGCKAQLQVACTSFFGCDGGGGLLAAGPLVVSGSITFRDCDAEGKGGGLVAKSVLNVSGSAAFRDCFSRQAGGGLAAQGPFNVIGSTTFKGCKANGPGGGLYALSYLNISGSAAFDSCIAFWIVPTGFQGIFGGGGACVQEVVIIQRGAQATFKDCETKAKGSGGGLFAVGNLKVFGSIAFENCEAFGDLSSPIESSFEDNGPTGGGAHAGDVIIGNLAKATFKNCKAPHGGGLRCRWLYVNGSIAFERCQGGTFGGGAVTFGGVIIQNLAKATFKDCKALLGGGGLYVPRNTRECFFNCEKVEEGLHVFGSIAFIGCKVFGKVQPAGGGGAFAINVIIWNLAKATFQDCYSAGAGGGLSVDGWLNVSGSVAFESCASLHIGGGGTAANAIVRNDAKVTFTDCNSFEGGGFYVHGMFVHSGSSTFTRCHADGLGGGFFIDDGNLTLENVSFINCSAHEGGAVYVKSPSISLAGEIRFDSCYSLAGSSGLAVEEPSRTQVTVESNLRFSFINMCVGVGESEILIWANFERESNFSAELLGASGRTLMLATSSYLFSRQAENDPRSQMPLSKVTMTRYPVTFLHCIHCPFGKFSFEPDTRLGSTCTECEPLYNEVFENDISSFPCTGNVVEIPEGIMLTKQNGRYDAWICPNKDVCQAKTINTSADTNVCKTGYNDTVTLPACVTCIDGYGTSQYDPFVCLKCSSSKMSLITPLFFYLLAIYSAGQQRKPMAAIQNIMISFLTMSTSSLSVLRESSSVEKIESAIQEYISTLIDLGNVPIYSPSVACLFPSCNEFGCAVNGIGLSLGLGLLYYPCAEILHRVAALRRSHFGPQGDCRTRLMVQAAVASNYFMPALMGVVLKLLPCVVIQNKVDGGEVTRSAWFSSETCDSEEQAFWAMLAFFGAILCIAFGPVYHCWLIARAQQWSEDERDDALGFTLSIYCPESKFGGFAKYWDAVIILRKMLFISVSMLFPLSYNASEYSVATIAVMVFYLILHMYVLPYKKHIGLKLNRLEALSQMTSLVSLLLSLSVRDLIHPSLFSTVTSLTIIAFINSATFMVIAYRFLTVALQDSAIKSLVHKVLGKRGVDVMDRLNKVVSTTGRPDQPLLSQTRGPVPDQAPQRNSEDPVAFLRAEYPSIGTLDIRLAHLSSRIQELENT